MKEKFLQHERSRTLSDAEKIKGGAEYVKDKDVHKSRLEFTSEQVEEARNNPLELTQEQKELLFWLKNSISHAGKLSGASDEIQRLVWRYEGQRAMKEEKYMSFLLEDIVKKAEELNLSSEDLAFVLKDQLRELAISGKQRIVRNIGQILKFSGGVMKDILFSPEVIKSTRQDLLDRLNSMVNPPRQLNDIIGYISEEDRHSPDIQAAAKKAIKDYFYHYPLKTALESMKDLIHTFYLDKEIVRSAAEEAAKDLLQHRPIYDESTTKQVDDLIKRYNLNIDKKAEQAKYKDLDF